MNPARFAYLLMGLFLASEGYLRQGQRAKSLEAGEFDKDSTRLIGMAHGASILILLLAPVLGHYGIGRFSGSKRSGWAGIVVMLTGIGLRVWANRTLGQFYTRTLVVTEDQHIVDEGPYQVVRHPGYLGALTMWLGAGLATENWLAALLLAVIMSLAYRYRIRSEESMLTETFSEQYRDYASQTWTLVPFIF